MKTRFIPTSPIPPVPFVPEPELDVAAGAIEPVAPFHAERGVAGAVEGGLLDVQPSEAPQPVQASSELEAEPQGGPFDSAGGDREVSERAAVDESLTFQAEPGGRVVSSGVVYANAVEWMTRNGLPYNKSVVMRGYPHMSASWPCTLGTAMLYAAYLAGEGRAFEILLPDTEEPLLVGGDAAGQLYGVNQVAAELTRLYEVQRSLFLLYQASFPTRLTLGEEAGEGSIAEVFILQLSGMLEQAHERTKRAEGALNVMDLIGVAVALSLRKLFGGLVPLDRLGALLQDTERMDWLQQHADELLSLSSRYPG